MLSDTTVTAISEDNLYRTRFHLGHRVFHAFIQSLEYEKFRKIQRSVFDQTRTDFSTVELRYDVSLGIEFCIRNIRISIYQVSEILYEGKEIGSFKFVRFKSLLTRNRYIGDLL